MSGAFQADAFQNDAFQVDAAAAGIPAGGGLFVFAQGTDRRAQDAEKRRIARQIAVLLEEDALNLLEVI